MGQNSFELIEGMNATTDDATCMAGNITTANNNGGCAFVLPLTAENRSIWTNAPEKYFIHSAVGAKNYELLPAAAKKPLFSQVLYYFPPRIMVSEEKFFYTFLSLMAEIGGYVGLLLGVSLFHFADWLTHLAEGQIEKYEKRAKGGKEVAAAGPGGGGPDEEERGGGGS